jgi:hypothetical protein
VKQLVSIWVYRYSRGRYLPHTEKHRSIINVVIFGIKQGRRVENQHAYTLDGSLQGIIAFSLHIFFGRLLHSRAQCI